MAVEVVERMPPHLVVLVVSLSEQGINMIIYFAIDSHES